MADIALISSRTTLRLWQLKFPSILEIGSWSSVGKFLGIMSDAWLVRRFVPMAAQDRSYGMQIFNGFTYLYTVYKYSYTCKSKGSS